MYGLLMVISNEGGLVAVLSWSFVFSKSAGPDHYFYNKQKT